MRLVQAEQAKHLLYHHVLQDRGLHYGHGVFETVACQDRQPLLWSSHLKRLQAGAQALSIPIELDTLSLWVKQALISSEAQVLKVIVTAGCAPRGYAGHWLVNPSGSEQTHVFVESFEFPKSVIPMRQQGCRVLRCQQSLAMQPALAGFKHLNRLEQVLASQEVVQADYDEGLMLSQNGEVISATSANLFIIDSGSLKTPCVQSCGIKGIIREQIIEIAAALQIPFEETHLTWEAVLEADEIFICNSIRGIWPVTQVTTREYPIGDITRNIQAQLGDCVV